MKPHYLFFLLFVGVLIFASVKNKREDNLAANSSYIQREEAPTTEQLTKSTFRVITEIESPEDENVADILWMQEAAQLALDKNIPWFNVLNQEIENGIVEGVIELTNDPMKAEYDANEILSLQLTDDTE